MMVEPRANPATEFVDSPPEMAVARDLVRRSVWVAPVLIAISGLAWGTDGLLSSAFGVALVLVNFLLAAALMGWASKISLTALMVASLAGFFVRMGIIVAAVLLVRDQPWVELVPLGVTILVTHLGLLLWETKYVSLSLAYPGLKPSGKEIAG